MFYRWHLDADLIPILVSPYVAYPGVELEDMKLRIDAACKESGLPHAELLNIYKMSLASLNLQKRAERFPHEAQEASSPPSPASPSHIKTATGRNF